MIKKGFVIETDGTTATVMPLEKDDCATCSSECAKKSATLVINNTGNLPVKLGAVVQYQSPKRALIVQGLISLLLPVLCAIAGYLLASPVCRIFNRTAGEGAKALGVLILFILSAGIVFFVSRKRPMPRTPEIVAIL